MIGTQTLGIGLNSQDLRMMISIPYNLNMDVIMLSLVDEHYQRSRKECSTIPPFTVFLHALQLYGHFASV